MRTGRVVAIVVGCLLAVPGVALLLGGAGLGIATLAQRDDHGYFDTSLQHLDTSGSALVSDDLAFDTDPTSSSWALDLLDMDVRIRATDANADRDVFVGIARTPDVEAYLAGAAYDEVVDIDEHRPAYRRHSGEGRLAPPSDESFWVASTSGAGTQVLTWEAASGDWTAVAMNADGTPGVALDVRVGVRSGLVGPLAIAMLCFGIVVTALAVVLILVGARGDRQLAGTPPPASTEHHDIVPGTPVRLGAQLDTPLSRWRWMVKWILALPHAVTLCVLWLCFVVLTVVAGVAILFTGRYPDSIFRFNVGVLRWTWRVSYYAGTGGIGTDRYPPFSLGAVPDYPATLEIDPPRTLSRGLVLVKWWLLAIPHYLILSLISGAWGWDRGDGLILGGNLLGLLVVVAGVMLLFTDRYPQSLFDLVIGLNRWVYRVIAYSALMTDEYPPFRLDQGGREPLAHADHVDRAPAEGVPTH